MADLNNTDIVGVIKWTGLSILETSLRFHTQHSQNFIQNGEKKKF